MTFSIQPLGQLKRIDAREVWKHEALHFTPWLKENIHLLAEALRMELELPEIEVAVGEFSCDVVAQEPDTGRRVVIENQLEQTDHGHLGQALTYAAGQDARTIVWISPEFREPHRQAIDWLNTDTDESLSFFAVEVELLQIDNSVPAPHFKVVAQPNNWQKVIKTVTTPPTEKGLLYQQFWSDLRAAYSKKYPTHKNAKHTPPQNWITIASAGRSGFAYGAAFTKEFQLKVELWIDTGNQIVNKAAFDALSVDKVEIESLIGASVCWERLETAKSSRIVACRPALVTDASPLRELHIEWATDMLGRLRNAFSPRLNALYLGEPAGDSLT
jgi:hypothetical protein